MRLRVAHVRQARVLVKVVAEHHHVSTGVEDRLVAASGAGDCRSSGSHVVRQQGIDEGSAIGGRSVRDPRPTGVLLALRAKPEGGARRDPESAHGPQPNARSGRTRVSLRGRHHPVTYARSRVCDRVMAPSETDTVTYARSRAWCQAREVTSARSSV